MSGERPESLILSVETDRAVDENEVESVRAAATRYLSGQDPVVVVPDGWRLVAPYEVQSTPLQPAEGRISDGRAGAALALSLIAVVLSVATFLWR